MSWRRWMDFLPIKHARRESLPEFEVREVQGPPVPERTEIRALLSIGASARPARRSGTSVVRALRFVLAVPGVRLTLR